MSKLNLKKEYIDKIVLVKLTPTSGTRQIRIRDNESKFEYYKKLGLDYIFESKKTEKVKDDIKVIEYTAVDPPIPDTEDA